MRGLTNFWKPRPTRLKLLAVLSPKLSRYALGLCHRQLQLTSHANSPPLVRLDAYQIPYLESSTSDVHRNQVLESWLRRIELHGQTDEDRICLAQCFYINNAELVINFPQFDSILTWPHFKTCSRFRDTSCSNDFCTTL